MDQPDVAFVHGAGGLGMFAFREERGMHQRIYSDVVGCTAETVWRFIADARNDRRWRREVAEVELLSGTPPFAPAAYREYLKWSALSGEALIEIVESTPGSRVVVTASGSGFSSRSAWTFEPQGAGTLVTLNFSLEATRVLGMTEGVLWKLADGWLSRDLPLLEGHLSCSTV